MITLTPRGALLKDAENRALRTFLTGLAIDVAVGLALVLGSYFATADGWTDVETAVLTFSVAKSVVQSACSYVLRRFLDPSKFPTPLPPVNPGPPATEEPAP